MIPLQSAGANTAVFGHWLTRHLEGLPGYQDHQVYYDHGDPKGSPNVAAIKGIYGESVSLISQLAQVDVLVAQPDREIRVVVEIEERFSSPKKIVGDVFTLLMCNRFSVRLSGQHEYFRITPRTKLVIAGTMKVKGSKREQLERVILPRIRQFTMPEDAIDPRKVSFILKRGSRMCWRS